MGSASRPKPEKLAKKLLQVRENLKLTQIDMVERLSPDQTGISQSSLTNIELGKREPNLLLLLRYAQIAGVTVDVLIDDKIDLTEFIKTLS